MISFQWNPKLKPQRYEKQELTVPFLMHAKHCVHLSFPITTIDLCIIFYHNLKYKFVLLFAWIGRWGTNSTSIMDNTSISLTTTTEPKTLSSTQTKSVREQEHTQNQYRIKSINMSQADSLKWKERYPITGWWWHLYHMW